MTGNMLVFEFDQNLSVIQLIEFGQKRMPKAQDRRHLQTSISNPAPPMVFHLYPYALHHIAHKYLEQFFQHFQPPDWWLEAVHLQEARHRPNTD